MTMSKLVSSPSNSLSAWIKWLLTNNNKQTMRCLLIDLMFQNRHINVDQHNALGGVHLTIRTVIMHITTTNCRDELMQLSNMI